MYPYTLINPLLLEVFGLDISVLPGSNIATPVEEPGSLLSSTGRLIHELKYVHIDRNGDPIHGTDQDATMMVSYPVVDDGK